MDEITYRKIRNAITTAPKLNLTWKDFNENSDYSNQQITDPETLKLLVLDFLKVKSESALSRNLQFLINFLTSMKSWCLEERLRGC